jgi:hypothetical protein
MVVDFLKHGADENVIFIYYIVGKANDSATNPTPAKLYGQFLKVRYGSKTVGIGPFKYMGDIDGIFVPLQ